MRHLPTQTLNKTQSQNQEGEDGMYVMYDSVTVSEIPRTAQAVAGYVGGRWPTYEQLAREFPRAHKLSIAINAGEDAECLDIENGDATPEEAPAWFQRQEKRGVHRPVLYGSLSVMGQVVGHMTNAGIERKRYRVWTAHYTGVAHLCGPHEGLSTEADATQWTDKALGQNLDESITASDFFATPADPLATLTPAERQAVEHLNQLRHQIWTAAEHGRLPNGHPTPRGWRYNHRAERYRKLRLAS